MNRMRLFLWTIALFPITSPAIYAKGTVPSYHDGE